MGCAEPVCSTLMCPSSGRQTVGNEASQTVHWKDHTVSLTPHPARMLCGLSVRSSVSMAFTGNKRPRMASSRLNVDSPRLTIYLEFAPDSRRWWINTAGSVRGAAMCTPRLEDTTNAIIMPLMQHPSAGWWIPLIKDLWCCIVVFSMYSFSATNIILT